MTEPLVLGVDVGGTKLAGIAVRGASVIARRRRLRTSAPLAQQVARLARVLGADVGAAPSAIGVAVPGQVDVATGVIDLAVNLGVAELPIGSLVSDELGIPCAVEHDARAVAAWLAGRPASPADLAYLSIGTGIAAGVVIGGRLLRGAAGLAGEIGHLLADPAGTTCTCGLVGCLETIASGPSIERAAAEALASSSASRLSGRPTAAEVYRASVAGDALAARVVARAAIHLAAAVRGLALGYGVPLVILGGGVTRAGAAFADPLRAALARERSASALAARAFSPDGLEILDDRLPWGALGASAVARGLVSPPASHPQGEVALR